MIHFEESNVFSHLPHLPGFLPTHAHSHDIELDENGMVLDPNAAWIAALSVVVKEWMYRITKKVGDEENSSVLLANVSRRGLLRLCLRRILTPSPLCVPVLLRV